MSRRALLRTVALAVLATVLLAAAGMVAWDWVSDYMEYRRISYPGHEPPRSLKEFLQYRRVSAMGDAAERLRDAKAHAEEVRETLGEPDRISEVPGEEISWFYSGGVFRGHKQPTLVVSIDPVSSRVSAIGFINHN